jgi:hypothetical protein
MPFKPTSSLQSSEAKSASVVGAAGAFTAAICQDLGPIPLPRFTIVTQRLPRMPHSPSRSRRPVRHTVHIRCQIVRESDFRLVADTVVNVSGDGVLVAPADPVLTGEKVVLSFRSPTGAGWIDAEATVARVLHGRRPGEFQRALGLKFDRLDESSKAALKATLAHAPPSPPGLPRHDMPDENDNEAFPLLRKVA